MLIEGWDDALPADLEKYGPKLRYVADELDKADAWQSAAYRLSASSSTPSSTGSWTSLTESRIAGGKSVA